MAAYHNLDLNDAAGWTSFASGGACCRVEADGAALRVDYDFRGEKGFVGIRRPFGDRLPDPFSFAFRIRGDGPRNALEFKLADRSNENAWRWRDESFALTPGGDQLTLRESDIEFAWGPAGGGRLKKAGAIELVIAAGPGGKGTFWIEDLKLVDRSSRDVPVITASTHTRGGLPSHVWTNDLEHGWRPSADDGEPWLQFEFTEPREYGGLIIDWGPRPANRRFVVEASDNGRTWKALYRVSKSAGRRSFVPLPGGDSRFLRLSFAGTVDVRHIEFQSFDFAKSRDDLYFSMAKRSAKGSFPRYLVRQQSYWTCAGSPNGESSALLNEEGLVEPDRGTFSIEPFLKVAGRLVTWADVKRRVRLEPGGLAIPTAEWKGKTVGLETTLFATGAGDQATLFIRYRVKNLVEQPQRIMLFAAIRPHQVSPPWQKWKTIGGVSEIREIAWNQDAVVVNDDKRIVPLTKPATFGALTFDEGLLTDALASERLPGQDHVRDPHGLASAALGFALALSPGQTQTVCLAVPFGPASRKGSATVDRLAALDCDAQFEEAVRTLGEATDQVTFQLPAGVPTAAADTFRTAAGQILINRDGPALQPGPRRYTRSWIRDGAIMGAALARAGNASPLAEFVRWYAPFQRKDGFVPCCVDREGPDPLVEHDSHGQLIYAAMEAFRFSHDQKALKSLWPALRKAAAYLETLTQQQPKSTSPHHAATFGLLPESASHEGYLAQPVHSYWDDFWGIRGLMDAAMAATELGHPDDAKRFAGAADALSRATQASIRQVIQSRQLDYVPGSVEWADFDPTATANALDLFADTAGLPEEQLRAMFQLFVTDSRQRHRGDVPWKNYTAYEIRIVGALVRLGWREEAQEFLEFYLSDRRPRAWNQWPEISWRDPRSPGHLGDVPHTWIGAEYMLVFASLFAYERESDSSLVIAAGIPATWITSRGLAAQGLGTWYGRLNLRMRRRRSELEIEIGGELRMPPGGIVLRPPCSAPIESVEVDGRRFSRFTTDEVHLDRPAGTVTITFEHAVAIQTAPHPQVP
ncbi:F5/8 type C domain protein [Caulifigura coniformis]|uniref:F5/8 type C domain protein n=1 Tax=Caulifigura coniformis TaxID=2527983 RepID=A0A517SDJ8_9PLAN|nr:discoidin domain-containing protein [Caulifigura coniformis]QDT54202.1 F5/8 type C domain protein [Caulifigura coniformis]